MSNNFKYIPFLPHNHECVNCTNRKDPQYVMSSTILTISLIAVAFVISFALNQALKETFEKMFPKAEEVGVKWNYFFVALAGGIIVIFLLMYNLNGTKW